MQLPTNLLGPIAGGVGEQREFGVGLAGLVLIDDLPGFGGLLGSNEAMVAAQRGVGIGPRPEVARGTVDFLGPLACRVRKKGEVGSWLGGFASGGRIARNVVGHGNRSSQ